MHLSQKDLVKEIFQGKKTEDICQATVDYIRRLDQNNPPLSYGGPLLHAFDAVIALSDDPDLVAQSFIQAVLGIAQAREQGLGGDRIKDSLCLTIAYKALEDRQDKLNVLGCITKTGRVDELLDAISRFSPSGEGMKRFVERCSNDSFFIVRGEVELGANKTPGVTLIDRVLDKSPELALSVDVAGMLGRVENMGSGMVFRRKEEEEATARVIKKSLGAWLDNDKQKPYRPHLSSGPKQAAEDVICGLEKMRQLGMLVEEDMAELTEGKRGARLDKTLARANSLIKPRDYKIKGLERDQLMELRAWARRASFGQKAPKKTKSTTKPSPLM